MPRTEWDSDELESIIVKYEALGLRLRRRIDNSLNGTPSRFSLPRFPREKIDDIPAPTSDDFLVLMDPRTQVFIDALLDGDEIPDATRAADIERHEITDIVLKLRRVMKFRLAL